jgi:ABC-type transport system involved in multi-copper enzyme maturation permease subunit
MSGLIRAEWIRFRGRRGLQIIVLAVPLLAAFFFLAGYSSIAPGPTFDEQAVRQEFIDQGVLLVPPDEADQAEANLKQMIDQRRADIDQERAQAEAIRARYAFPQSLLTVLASAPFIFFAMILLTATSIGDDFSWGTIRTSLIASSDRRRFLLVRIGFLAVVASVLVAFLIVLGIALPLLLVVTGASLPSPPGLDAAAFALLLIAEVVAAVTVIGFAALATLLVRSGALTLVVALVYVAIEAAILALLLRFEAFQPAGAFGRESDGTAAWVLNVLPVRSMLTLLDTLNKAAGAQSSFPGEVVLRDLGAARLPLISVLVVAALFTALAFRRFGRMDIVE